MNETNYIVMTFKKSNNEQHSIKLAYPKLPAVGSDIKALGEFIVDNSVFSFDDATTLSTFEKAAVQTIKETDIDLEA